MAPTYSNFKTFKEYFLLDGVITIVNGVTLETFHLLKLFEILILNYRLKF